MKMITLVSIVVLTMGCKDPVEPIGPDPSTSFCKEVTVDQSFIDFHVKFLFDDPKSLKLISTTVDGDTQSQNISYNSDGTVKDYASTSYIYAGTDLTVEKIIDEDGNPHYLYFNKGHCTGLSFSAGDEVRNFENTYNADGDCIKVEGTAESADSSDKETITIEYLTDKLNPFPTRPEFVEIGLLYQLSPAPFSHKHLISKINRTWTVTTKNGSNTFNFVQSYTYTYDDKGRVKTMVHTGNPQNTYTFTYAQCL
jgi:hypothetical protein